MRKIMKGTQLVLTENGIEEERVPNYEERWCESDYSSKNSLVRFMTGFMHEARQMLYRKGILNPINRVFVAEE